MCLQEIKIMATILGSCGCCGDDACKKALAKAKILKVTYPNAEWVPASDYSLYQIYVILSCAGDGIWSSEWGCPDGPTGGFGAARFSIKGPNCDLRWSLTMKDHYNDDDEGTEIATYTLTSSSLGLSSAETVRSVTYKGIGGEYLRCTFKLKVEDYPYNPDSPDYFQIPEDCTNRYNLTTMQVAEVEDPLPEDANPETEPTYSYYLYFDSVIKTSDL